jgi:ABC-2 type transport system permease protein
MWARALLKLFRKSFKHGAVFRISLLHQFAYIYDFILRTLFLIIILFIFSNLWGTTYNVQGNELIEGYTLTTLMWYLVITESLIMGMPALVDRIEREVKNGEIAYFLNRPISYLGYQYGIYMSEALVRVFINIVIGGILIYLMYGGISVSFGIITGFVALVVMALSLQFVTVMIVCLGSFWVEDIRGYHLIYSRLLMILGGMMIPLEIFPDWLEQITKMLPFQSIVYLPATFFVGTQEKSIYELIGVQGMWISVFVVLLAIVFQMGVKKLNVNGG